MNVEELERKVQEAAIIIKAGGLVVYPTETVYGLAADPRNRIAILKVFGAKNRPMDNPLSVAVRNLDQADDLVYLNAAVKKVAKAFLPGPLTVVLKKKALLPKELTGGLDKVGIRIPGHPVALRLIELAGPITATSANVSGEPAPVTADEAKEQLGDKVNFILDTGVSGSGQPSTVVDLSEKGKIEILRGGNISKKMLESVLKDSAA
jgi:L-threonylcarbamoyladenylate synthase